MGCGAAKQVAPEEPLDAITAVLEALAADVANPKRYIDPAAIWAVLELGWVRLVRMTYLIELSTKKGGVLPRRQELPEEAFISVKELKQMYYSSGDEGDINDDGSNHDKVLPLIVISFCWITAQHPDPKGEQLKTVAEALEREKAKYAGLDVCDEDSDVGSSFGGFKEMGVFWDWPSLHQKDTALFDPAQTPEAKPEAERAAFVEALKNKTAFYGGEAYEKSRTPEEIEAFRKALHHSMDLWYAHQGTIVYKLTKLPEGCTTRKASYDDSGWTTYEGRTAELIKRLSSPVYAKVKWNLVLDLGAEDVDAPRRWPVGPDDFEGIIKEKTFTNGADTGVVTTLYRNMSTNQFRFVKRLDFGGGTMAPPTVEDAQRLGRCLNMCKHLEYLFLRGVGLTAATCKALFSVMTGTALGLKWTNVGAVAPTGGRELTNAKLSFALKRKTDFKAEDLATFELGQLQPTDYIKSGGSYFQLAMTGEAHIEKMECAHYLAPRCLRDAPAAPHAPSPSTPTAACKRQPL